MRDIRGTTSSKLSHHEHVPPVALRSCGLLFSQFGKTSPHAGRPPAAAKCTLHGVVPQRMRKLRRNSPSVECAGRVPASGPHTSARSRGGAPGKIFSSAGRSRPYMRWKRPPNSVAVVGEHRIVAVLEEVGLVDRHLLADDAAAVDAAAQHPVDAAMAVVGALVAVLAEGAPELGDHDHDRVVPGPGRSRRRSRRARGRARRGARRDSRWRRPG